VIVRHSRGVYDVRFSTMQEAMRGLPEGAFVVTDENVQAAWGHLFPPTSTVLTVPPGESSKSMARLEWTLRLLADSGAVRSSVVAAVGGGVVGDLAGLAAALYMRGLRYFQVPTSLLAQVDSSVGGKVAVDLPEGKNLVGAFYPPETVLVPTDALQTLPAREFRAGMAEVWKCGFILDRDLVETLRQRPMGPDDPRLPSVVERCIDWKRQIVEEDEYETTGRRAILNFGHTVGHALERLSEYRMLHGEAVSIGMVVEAKLGERLGVTQEGTAAQVLALLCGEGLPVECADLARIDELIEAMKLDKKAGPDGLAFSLLTFLGGCKLVRAVSEAPVRAVLNLE
jgi:3-dehydroquinate synthase